MIPRFGANPAVQASPAHRPRAALHPAGQPWGASWATLARPRRGWRGWGGEAACPGGIPGNRPSSRRPHPWARAPGWPRAGSARWSHTRHLPSGPPGPRPRFCVPRVLHTDGKRSVEGPRGKAAGSWPG